MQLICVFFSLNNKILTKCDTATNGAFRKFVFMSWEVMFMTSGVFKSLAS